MIVSSRLGRDFIYLYSTNNTPAGPAYIASGTPPVYVSWIFHLYTSGCSALCMDLTKLCSFIIKWPVSVYGGPSRYYRTWKSPLTYPVLAVLFVQRFSSFVVFFLGPTNKRDFAIHKCFAHLVFGRYTRDFPQTSETVTTFHTDLRVPCFGYA